MTELNDKEKAELKKREEGRAVALKNIDSKLWDYALPKLMTFENFGRFSETAQRKYLTTIKDVPSKEVYEQIFLPQSADESGAVTSPYIQNTSAAILQQSFALMKVDDIMKYVGSKKSIAEKYAGKYLADLDKKEAGTIIGMAMSYGINKKVVESAGDESKGIAAGLEQLVCEEELAEAA